MIRQYKFPTILGLVVLVVGVVAGIFLVQNRQIFAPKASPEETPQMVKITNITNRSFSVSWITDKKTTGFVSFGKTGSLGATSNQTASLGETSNVHYVQVENLIPATQYFFKVGSGKNLFDNDGQPYTITTGPALEALPQPDVIFGKIEGLTEQAILYVTLAGVTPLSTLVESSGTWSIPLSTARNSNLDGYARYDKKESVADIIVQSPGRLTTAKVKTGSAHPVPAITLGKNQDFTNLKPLGEEVPSLPLSQLSLPQQEGTSSSGFSNLTPEKPETPQLAQGASPEATSSPAPKVKPSPSPSPSPRPKASPIPKPTPSPSPPPAGGATPSGRVSLPSTESGLPTSGDLTPMLGSVIMGVVLVLIGLFLPKVKVFD